MRNGYWIVLLSFVLLLSACNNNQAQQPEEETDQQDQTSDEEEKDTSSPKKESDKEDKDKQSSNVEEGIFADHVTELYFHQMDREGRSQRGIYEFTKDTLPTEPETLAFQDESLYMFISFNTTNETTNEKLLSQISVEGADSQKIEPTKSPTPSQTTRFKMIFKNVEDEVSFTFGDLPEIKLVRKEPLSITVEPAQDDEEALLFKDTNHGFLYPKYFMRKGSTEHLLHFSEPMKTNLNIADYVREQDVKVSGEWLDNQTYKIDIQGNESVRLNTSDRRTEGKGRILSQSGNYLPYLNVDFEKVEPGEWKNWDTGEKVGWSPRDAFYDFLLFSPDKSSYIGVKQIASAQGDSEGDFYGFVLERKGKEPKLLEHSVFTSVMRNGVPLEWIDQKHVLFNDDETIYKMNVETGEKEALLNRERHGGRINQFAHNPTNGEIYVLVEHFKESFENSRVDRWTFNMNQNQWNKEENYSGLAQSGVYWANDLAIHIADDGVLFSKVENGKIYTVYESYNGQNKKVLGEVILKTDNGVYLETRTGGHNNDVESVYFWNMGKEDPIKIENPPGSGPFAFGDKLLAYTKNKHYVYNKESGEWDATNQFKEVVEAYNFQEVAPIYKVQE